MLKWLNENWFKITLVVLGIGVLVLWHQQIKQTKFRDYLVCSRLNATDYNNLCNGLYGNNAGVK